LADIATAKSFLLSPMNVLLDFIDVATPARQSARATRAEAFNSICGWV
jgi:hypothetical protein